MKTLFVTGMFRSGTTLMSRMLHAHPDIGLASDGLFPFFKHLRSAVARRAGVASDSPFHAPLADYYFGEQKEVLDAILAADLDPPLAPEERRLLLDRVATWCTGHPQYAPLLEPHVRDCPGESFAVLLQGLLEVVHAVYGRGTATITAFKEVWTTEFIWALARSFPEMRFLCVVRDPRSVFASKMHRQALYPPLFLARQWRKLAALSLLAARDPALGPRVCVVRFEDLVLSPRDTTRQVCRFLDIAWNASMIRPESFVDGYGDPWRQNTAYGAGGTGFDPGAATSWEQALTGRETAFVEGLCWPEAGLFGYEARHAPDLARLADMTVTPCLVEEHRLARWIKPFVTVSPTATALEMGREFVRAAMLRQRPSMDQEHGRDLAACCFLAGDIYEACARFVARGEG
ncbi:sulfotransferase family protein [Desulfolutivibrio sulfoxidireducens]|uniref:sulfotransferase family protein n=1 Tax=Desulfolutivibrio sulfoxidireducens TaxID=2773299 RepID=UPI00159D18E7|nr:sulfotransferase [Desulfolutivibrio sulfoxidireducens]QLA17057.1 hypothetical protein GD605_13630 [Desulfolutivibrio sulfoxidireducens]QLA20625.1 hypothetical protein GD604_13345 [Desulfolutivibrio sulfoxidireducens]